ncbi:hypothetical protein LSAT2_008427, partial [Lamellibrachia satsuma]
MALARHAPRQAGRNDSVQGDARQSCRVSNSIIAHWQVAGLYRAVTGRHETGNIGGMTEGRKRLAGEDQQPHRQTTSRRGRENEGRKSDENGPVQTPVA